jgi:NAD(P)-dependent dehydrogenase (short-subunit alcohol dehydrogenase family)
VAGILRDRMIFNMSEQEWDDVIRVHLKGHFNTIKPAAAWWRDQRNPDGHYRLINFTSVSGLFGAPGQPNYAAAKMGIVGLTYSCANSLGKYGVTANAISPGAATRMTQSVPDDRRRGPARSDDERSPDNVAPIVAYLASVESDWLTGRVIGASGYDVILFSNPEPVRQLTGQSRWDVDQLAAQVERVFKPVVGGTS